MDSKVTTDTKSVHCSLNKQETQTFIRRLFSDERIHSKLDIPSSASNTGQTFQSILTDMEQTMRKNGRWESYPNTTDTLAYTEESIAAFFNSVIQHTRGAHMCTRRWTAKASQMPLEGLAPIRKPDLVLCEERLLTKTRLDIRTDVIAMGEIKKNHSDANHSYTELAGKTAFLLEAQDGRYAAPGIRILGSQIILTVFDRGGSISTFPLDIHENPEEFLRILYGITFADRNMLGFDTTISLVSEQREKLIQIIKSGEEYMVVADRLLFFSGSLHGRGTTVWSGRVSLDKGIVVVKDTWVDPLRRYTEGRILKKLEAGHVRGVPRLVHEQQVQTSHPITNDPINQSTHILRSLLENPSDVQYNLRVMSRLVSKPRGFPIYEFESLAELLVGLIDCVCAHRDAFRNVHVIHRDISLFNLFYIIVKGVENLLVDFTERLEASLEGPEVARVREAVSSLPRRGLLGDWGYAVPVTSDEAPSVKGGSIGIRVEGQSTSLSRTDLGSSHNITIPVADEPLPDDSDASADASLLQRTGTWSWMAAELCHIGPGKPVTHRPHHDLESFFYVLLSICLLFDEPGRPKPSKVLNQCFHPFFSATQPNATKLVTIQSLYGWRVEIISNISSYFQPLIPLLEKLREEMILSLAPERDGLHGNYSFTHDDFIDQVIVLGLSKLPETHWEAMSNEAANHQSTLNTLSSSSTPPSLSSTVATTAVSSLLDTALANHFLPRPILLETPRGSSASGPKRNLEAVDESVAFQNNKRSRK